jgi:hypothetical protein
MPAGFVTSSGPTLRHLSISVTRAGTGPINRSQIQATSQIKKEQERSRYGQEYSAEAIAETGPASTDSAPAAPAAKRSPTPHDCLLRMRTFKPRKNASGRFQTAPIRTASMQDLIVNLPWPFLSGVIDLVRN